VPRGDKKDGNCCNEADRDRAGPPGLEAIAGVVVGRKQGRGFVDDTRKGH